MRVCVLASGRGSNLTSLLDKIDEGAVDAEVTLVLSDRAGAPCLETARVRGVPAVAEIVAEQGETRVAYDARLRDTIASEAPDLIVLAGFMRILSPEFVDAFAGQIINIHPALLPSFKGAHGIRDTLVAGAPLAGCTTHFVTSELDGGPMILQAALAVGDSDEADLAARVLAMEHLLLPRTVQLFAEGGVAGTGHVRAKTTWQTRPDVPSGSLFSAGF